MRKTIKLHRLSYTKEQDYIRQGLLTVYAEPQPLGKSEPPCPRI